MTKFLNLILILLLVSSCDNILSSSSEETEPFLTSEKTTDILQIKLNITSEEIRSLEDIKAQFKLKNITGKEVIYGFASGCQYGYTVTRNENIIFDSRENLMCTAAVTELRLESGQTKTFPISLDIFDIDKKLDKGMYELKAFLLKSNATKISTSFKVE